MAGSRLDPGRATTRPAAADPSQRILGIGEVAMQPTIVRCMGRSYRATVDRGTVTFSDVTDITFPFPLGTARAVDGGAWDILSTRGAHLGRTADLLPAIAVLREAHSPTSSLRPMPAQ